MLPPSGTSPSHRSLAVLSAGERETASTPTTTATKRQLDGTPLFIRRESRRPEKCRETQKSAEDE
jgi:hypothetical protein